MKQVGPSEPLVWRGYRLELMPQKAVWDPQQRLLLAADLHLGKAECLQAHGIALPSDGDHSTLDTLLGLAHHLKPQAVVVLGDLIHGRTGLTVELRQKLAALPELLGCPLRLIDGNHERGSWLAALRREPSMALGPLWLSHAPEPRDDHLNLCGHLHPVAVVGQGADRLRLPCFALLRGESAPAHALASRDAEALPNQPGSAHAVHCPGDCLVLPAFGHLTGGHPCSEADGVWLVAEGSVVPWRVPARSLPEPSLGNRTTSPTPTTASPRIRRSRA